MRAITLPFRIWIGAALLAAGAAGQDSHGFGPVDPVAVPDIKATRHDGQTLRLRELLTGQRTAVQFIFVNCTTACPLLGSLFKRVEQLIPGGNARLLSITVDPEHDTPERLAGWLRTFRGGPRWSAVRVAPADMPALLKAFQQEEGPPSGHTLQVFLVDPQARYVERTVQMPRASAVAAELHLGGAVRTAEANETRTGPLQGRDVYAGRGLLNGHVSGDRLTGPAARCQGCHGAAGEGGAEGETFVPPLTGKALTAARPRRGGPPSKYDAAAFCHGLRTGMDPAGVMFSTIMPRYEMDGRTCRQLWDFLTSAR